MIGLKIWLRRGQALALDLWRGFMARLFYRLAAGDYGSQVIERGTGAVGLGRRCCVFVHFDARGVVRPHTRAYLLALREAGFGIIFVTNSGVLAPDSRQWLGEHCAQILIRRNRGYDFGAYRDGIAAFVEERVTAEMLLLANDSLYGPLAPLGDIVGRMDFAAADIWALTDSWQHRYHLQSFFVAFGPAALANAGFAAFWQQVRNVRSKWATVHYYELWMTHHMLSAGLQCAAVWDYFALLDTMQEIHDAPEPAGIIPIEDKVRRLAAERALWCWRRRLALNPTSDLWLALLQHGFPFLKRELLRFNPGRAPDLHIWHRIVREQAPQMYRFIIDDLKLNMRKQAP
ncbi:rhamnan synthesis F family protein [Rhodovarius sp.]|uniref:rhamnan synthesis F family protein n=1 Tax=Rhodovarius sp. TaxID=2972673 RepID=UPI0034A1D2EB